MGASYSAKMNAKYFDAAIKDVSHWMQIIVTQYFHSKFSSIQIWIWHGKKFCIDSMRLNRISLFFFILNIYLLNASLLLYTLIYGFCIASVTQSYPLGISTEKVKFQNKEPKQHNFS